MKLTFYGGARSVTGANYLLETKKAKILVDCGLLQGSNFLERKNYKPFPYDPKKIDAVFVTHAHIDHTGRIPKLFKEGFSGSVFSTPPTKDFAEFLLLDSEHLLSQEAARHHRKPIYITEDVRRAVVNWEGIAYGEKMRVKDAVITFMNAAHILGSSCIVVEAEGKRVVFSGDLGNYPAPLIGNVDFLDEADYCIIESVYGDRLHNVSVTKSGIIEDLIEEVAKNRGTLMIPSFAMERTQKLLYEINELVENERIPRVPIFVDSPLAIKLTGVYQKYENYFSDKAAKKLIQSGDKLFNFQGLKTTLTTEESKMINGVAPPKVIIAGSGMSNGGRILHHERRHLSDPRSAILFVGYQATGSLGRRIIDGAKEVVIFGESVPVRCHVAIASGYSAHADQQQLLDWLIPMHQKLKKVFVVQGEETASRALAQRIKDELGISAMVPETNISVKL